MGRPLQLRSAGGHTVEVYDLRATSLRPHPRAEKEPRPLKQVRGAVMHQTAVTFSPGRWVLGRDPLEALFARLQFGPYSHQPFNGRKAGKRYGGVRAHLFVREGMVVILNDATVELHGSNGSNPEAYQVEVEGLFPGMEKHRRSRWARMRGIRYSKMTPLLAASIEVSLEVAREQAPHLVYLWAHRQTSSKRRGDPGEAIWNVAARYGQGVLGLITQPGRTWWRSRGRSGRKLPSGWIGGAGKY